MQKAIVLTAHARIRLQERHIPLQWIEDAAFNSEWTEPDPKHIGAERRFRTIAAFGNRILRVVCVETKSEIRVISAMFDRNARRKP